MTISDDPAVWVLAVLAAVGIFRALGYCQQYDEWSGYFRLGTDLGRWKRRRLLWGMGVQFTAAGVCIGAAFLLT